MPSALTSRSSSCERLESEGSSETEKTKMLLNSSTQPRMTC